MPARSTQRPGAHRADSSRRHSSVSSVRVGDLRGGGIRKRAGRTWLVRFVLGVLVVAALAGVGLFLYFSDVLSVEEVSVSGVHHLTADEMSSLAAVPASSTLLRIDADSIRERMRTNPWVEDVQIKRIFPHAIELQVTERPIAAIVEVTAAEGQSIDNWAVSKEGIWLMLIPPTGSAESANVNPQIYDDASHVLHITDIPLDVKPEVGQTCSDESIRNALAIIAGFTTDLANRVSVVSATDTANTLLTLDDGVQIAFGTAENIRDKERICLQLMQEHPGQISYINVRVVERPTWRSTPSF